MDRVTLDFSLPNFITIGLIAALWYAILVGGFTAYAAHKGSKAR